MGRADAYETDGFLRGRFVIPASEVSSYLEDNDIQVEELLFSLIQPASRLAIPPTSGFYVGAVALGESGTIYVGVNVEFPSLPLNFSIHAEQCLIVNSQMHGERALRALAVSAAPCGHCRQFLAELNQCGSVEILFGKSHLPKALKDLLPERFGPEDLVQGAPFPLLLDNQAHALEFAAAAEEQLAARAADEGFQRAAAAALQKARESYAPYTHSYAGAAILDTNGDLGSGGCVESAAYNPTLSPLHTAIISMLVSRQGRRAAVFKGVLEEELDLVAERDLLPGDVAQTDGEATSYETRLVSETLPTAAIGSTDGERAGGPTEGNTGAAAATEEGGLLSKDEGGARRKTSGRQGPGQRKKARVENGEPLIPVVNHHAVSGSMYFDAEVCEIVLAEVEDAPVQYRTVADALIATVAPKAKLTLLTLRRTILD